MNNNSIEDIVIENRNSVRPKKGRGILIILVFLMILLVMLCAFYLYLKNNPIQQVKQIFFNSISNIDYDFYIDNKIYSEMLNKYIKNNSKTETNMTFSTTLEQSEEFKDIDFSKFDLNLNFIKNINNKETYSEFNIAYSDNDLIKFKAIDNENQFVWFSDEIVNKYVGVNKQNTKKILGQANLTAENKDIINEFSNVIDSTQYISSEEMTLDKTGMLKDYIYYTSNFLPEEKFSSQDNYVLEREGAENINVTAYTLKLTNQEYKNLINNLFSKLKSDEAILGKIVTGNEIKKINKNFTIKATTTNLEPLGTENTVTTEEIDTQNDVIENEEQPINEDVPTEETTNAENLSESNEVVNNSVVENNITIEQVLKEQQGLDLNQILIATLFNRKIDCSIEDLQEYIDKNLQNFVNGENGFELTVYVSEQSTEKIQILLPNTAKIDIEFSAKSNNQKNISITYLIEENGIIYGEDNAVIYSAYDNSIAEDIPVVTEKQINGFKIDFNKLQNDASTNIKVTYNFIENKEINKKITVDLTTDGTINSKNFDNELNIIYSSNDGEVKANLENTIRFGINAAIESLTEDNCLLIDSLPEEEILPTIEAIRTNLKTVYETKKESLTFIDTNTQTSLIKPMIISKDEARTVLINTISSQMGKAQEKGEPYTIQNIANLEISGHQVNVNIENNIATVFIDGHIFEIDSEFNLVDK